MLYIFLLTFPEENFYHGDSTWWKGINQDEILNVVRNFTRFSIRQVPFASGSYFVSQL